MNRRRSHRAAREAPLPSDSARVEYAGCSSAESRNGRDPLAFLPLFIVVYFARRSIAWRNAILLAFSLLFYAWGETVFVLLLLASIAFNWAVALAIDKADLVNRKPILILGICLNLVVLGVAKYADFIVLTVNAIYPAAGFPQLNLPLPLGISFFTFHAISYLFDVYRRNARAEESLMRVAVYIAMFPQLVAGPIVRSRLPGSCAACRRWAATGMRIFAWVDAKGADRQRGRYRRGRGLRARARSRRQRSLDRAGQLHAADLLRFRRIFEHGHRPRLSNRLRLPAQFRPSLYVTLGDRVLAALAHEPVALVPRLLYSARRLAPAGPDLSLRSSSSCAASGGKLEFCHLGVWGGRSSSACLLGERTPPFCAGS